MYVGTFRVEMEPTPENHTLLDTVSDVFDSSGGVLESRLTGVSIVIPPNAIPSGIQQEIYFKVMGGLSVNDKLTRRNHVV